MRWTREEIEQAEERCCVCREWGLLRATHPIYGEPCHEDCAHMERRE